MAIDSAPSILPKNDTRGFHWGQNTKRAIGKLVVPAGKGVLKGGEVSAPVVQKLTEGSASFAYAIQFSEDGLEVLPIIAAGHIAAAAVGGVAIVGGGIGYGIYYSGQSLAGLANSARKGIMNRTGLR